MHPPLRYAFILCASLFATGTLAADYTLERAIEVPSSPQDSWNFVGDFCDIDDWHPAISACRLKVIDGALHRVLTLADGGEFVEKRVAVEPGLSYTYRIVSSPLVLDSYTSTLSITAGDPTTITWSGRFSSDDPGMEEVVAGIYETGLAAIGAHLSK